MTVIVGITQRTSPGESYPEARDVLAFDWTRCLERLGLVAVPVSSASASPEKTLERVGCGAVVLSNGDDVTGWTDTPATPGAESSPPAWRDATEHRVLTWAIERGVPVLGVCRGLHFVNRFFGGTETRLTDDQIARHVAVEHRVEVTDATARAEIGEDAVVNSYHRVGVPRGGLAGELREIAASEDGYVEACVHGSLAITCVQWHPERHGELRAIDSWAVSRWLEPTGERACV